MDVSPDQVEQPSSSRLVDMPYLRLILDSDLVGGIEFRRLKLASSFSIRVRKPQVQDFFSTKLDGAVWSSYS